MKISKIIKPTSLVLFLSKRCDSRCPHCFWVSKSLDFFETSTDTDMSIDDAKRIIDEYYRIGVRHVNLQSEGEVLLYRHLEDLVTYCKRKGLRKFRLVTNGIKLDRYMDFISKNMAYLTISVDGYDAKTYIEHRGGTEAVFDKIMNNISEFVRNPKKCKISINSVIHDGNFDKAIRFVEMAENLGVNTIRFSNFHPVSEDEKLRPVSISNIKQMTKFFNHRKNKVNIKMPKIVSSKGPFYCSMLFKTVLVGLKYNMSPCCRINTDEKWGVFSPGVKSHNSKALCSFRKKFMKANRLSDLPLNCRQCSRVKKR